jgi:YidC/Oxa1 family membrane protein insertase
MNENNQRLLVTVALCMLVALAWSYFFNPTPKMRARPPGAAAETAQAPSPAAPPAQPKALAAPMPASPDVPRGTSPQARRYPTEKVVLESEKLRAVLTSDGGALAQLELKGDKFVRHLDDKADATAALQRVDLAAVQAGQPLPLATEVRGTDAAAAPLVPADASYEVVAREPGRVVFRTELNGVTVRKTVILDPQTYKLDVKVELSGAAALSGNLLVHYEATTLPEGQGGGGFFGSRTNVPSQAICEVAGGKPERLAPGAKKPAWDGHKTVFAGIDEQYFLAAMMPEQGTEADCSIASTKEGRVASTLSIPFTLAAGATVAKGLLLFAGPKETELLSSVAPALRDSVDLGFWWLIARVLLEVMKFFYKVVPPHNWGIAIILLTLSVKIVTFPLQHKSMKSMQEMQRLQPQLEEMKKKFAGDQQRQNLEQMKLFKEHGVNPMGSCLPMVIQMPVWIALYTTLQVSVELYHSVFIPGWLGDLTAQDPYYILPVGMGITMLLTQFLTPSPMQNQSQKVMGYAMTAFFSYLMLHLPSGLTLYIFVNNLLSIAQQIYLRRTMRVIPVAAAGATVAVSAKRV